ncbi:MAG: peptidylprolyl isomerase [Prevotella sp.]|nr:peptidylprolyl isomerase [Prevotella sp.]
MKAKLKALAVAVMFSMGVAQAQNDAVVMTINGRPVTLSEFEYSYNKNNSEGVIDKKNVQEYADLFINYKLKVAAALEAGIDTTKAFRDEFKHYRNQQIRPSFITDDDVEKKAYEIYTQTRDRVNKNGGLVKPAHILIEARKTVSESEKAAARQRADSVYQALLKGADFGTLAQKVSDDKGSAAKGGMLGWIQKGLTVKEFEDQAFAMNKGDLSKPFESPFGYHIIKLADKGDFFPYDTVRAEIREFIDAKGIREQIIDGVIKDMAAKSGLSEEQILDNRAMEMQAKDADLNNLVREYHDGLLLYEISNRMVWDKAANDKAGLERFFKKNKKRYQWTEPRFKGIAYHVKDAGDIKAVKDCLKGVDFEDWADKLRKTFNNDSVIRIRVEKGIFKKGDNKLIDKEIFKTNATVTPLKEYPLDAVYGTLLTNPKVYSDVKGMVVADYQDEMEKAWIQELRRKYNVNVNQSVLQTVNNHDK